MLALMREISTMYDRVGGDAFFEALTVDFYRSLAADPVLSGLYPDDEEEFEKARQHLEWFLIQYWGGPQAYNDRRGAPRLRMRHAPFFIGEAERDAWLRHMTKAVRAANLSPLDEAQMLGYFETAARHLVNRPTDGGGESTATAGSSGA
jgi:hemoglobin